MARFKIGSKVYTSAALDEVSLRDLVLFDNQSADMGWSKRWSDIERIATEWDALSVEEAETYPEKMTMIAVTIWVSRRVAGEDVTLDQALDIPLNSLDFLPEPEDKKPGKPKGAKKPRKSTPPSVVAVSPLEASVAVETSTTSESPSIPA